MAKVPGGSVHTTAVSGIERERRYVYGGAPAGGAAHAVHPNRKAVRRRFSTFNIILLLFGIGGAVVFYINNLIAITWLSADINRLQVKYDKIASDNAALQAEVQRKSEWKRISVLASDMLGLHPAERQPVLFSVDREKARALGVTEVPSR
jgi:hypothetical protein